MSTKTFSLVLELGRLTRPLDRPLAEVPAALLDALSPVVAPRRVWVLVDGARELEIERTSAGTVGEQRLWIGEAVVPDVALTRVSPSDDSIVDQLRGALGAATVGSLAMSADGALRHRAPRTPAPEWHGRWRIAVPECLLELATVRFQWDEHTREVELALSFAGYPLTSAELLTSGALGEGEPSVAEANRELVFDALSRVPAALGVPPGARWSDDGDYAALFAQDAADLRTRWLPRLNSALPRSS